MIGVPKEKKTMKQQKKEGTKMCVINLGVCFTSLHFLVQANLIY